MIRFAFLFLVLFGIFFFGIRTFRAMTGKEKLDFLKLLIYSIFCATLTILVLMTIVFLF